MQAWFPAKLQSSISNHKVILIIKDMVEEYLLNLEKEEGIVAVMVVREYFAFSSSHREGKSNL